VGPNFPRASLWHPAARPVEMHLAAGQPVLLENRAGGGRQVGAVSPRDFGLLIQNRRLLPNWSGRIRARGTDSAAAIEAPLQRARPGASGRSGIRCRAGNGRILGQAPGRTRAQLGLGTGLSGLRHKKKRPQS